MYTGENVVYGGNVNIIVITEIYEDSISVSYLKPCH
jgi:hypothetical protein